jgi:hypothetical protein
MVRSTPLSYLGFALLFIVAGVSCTQKQTESTSSGRFQLFQGPLRIVTIENPKKGYSIDRTEQALFKIDTVTGRVWRYGGIFDYWTSVPQEEQTLKSKWLELPAD